MPQIIIDYSPQLSDVDFKPLMNKINNSLVQYCDASLIACKSRAQVCHNYIVGDGKDLSLAFISILVKLVPGRTSQQKKEFTNSVDLWVKKHMNPTIKEMKLTCQWRMELTELVDYHFLGED